MTPKELELFTELQPHLLKFKGEWKVKYDQILVDGKAETIDSCYMGMIWVAMDKDSAIYVNNAIWLPRTIDTENPERGLWNMLDWKQWIAGQMYKDFYAQHHDKNIEFISTTPTEAILLALKSQWEAV